MRPEASVASKVAPTVNARTGASIVKNPVGQGKGSAFVARTSRSTAQNATATPDNRSHCRDEKTFRQHLPHESPAGRAECTANGQFFRTQSCPPKLHVHHVHARNQQNDDDRPEHRVNGLTQLRAGKSIQ